MPRPYSANDDGAGIIGGSAGVALDSSGNIIIADVFKHLIQVFDSSGNYINKFGTHGTIIGQLRSPQGVAVKSDKTIVDDTGNNRIQVFDSEGTFINRYTASVVINERPNNSLVSKIENTNHTSLLVPETPDEGEDNTHLSNTSNTLAQSVISNSQSKNHLIHDKQAMMIQAKILSRRGLYVKSLNIYKSLLKEFPDDEDLQINYIDTLVNFSDYDLALTKIDELLKNNPSNLEAKKIKARIYYERGKYKWTYDIYEDILKHNHMERGVRSDYAFAKLNAGDWTEALNYFSMILEHDPENKTALQGISEIQKAHRPRVETGYRSFTQSDDHVINTSSAVYTGHITKNTLISLDYEHINIDRPSDAVLGIKSLDMTINETIFSLRHQFSEKWEGEIGGGFYLGLDDGFSFVTGLYYKILDNGFLRANYFLNHPWYDPLEAADLDGSFSEIKFSFDWSFLKVWGLFLGVEQLDYYIDGSKDYGEKRGFTGIITRKIETPKYIPDLYLSYSFQRSLFDYEENNFRPISMVKSEQRHGVSLSLEHWFTNRCVISLAGSVSKDIDRELNAFSYSPGVKFRIGKSLELNISYDYSSESSNEGGGETKAFNFLLQSKL